MKNFQTALAAAFAAMIMLSSCVKDGGERGGANDRGTSSVRIQLVNSAATTRAEGAGVAGGSTMTLKPGHMFFCSPSGVIQTHIGIGNSAGSMQLTLTEVQNGEQVIEIQSSSRECYVISNDEVLTGGALTGDLTGTNISTVLGKSLAVGSINDASGSVLNAFFYGKGTVLSGAGQTAVAHTNYDASVTVTVKALMSRLQIGKIAGILVDDIAITGFTVEGIYINWVDKTMTVGSVASPVTPTVNNGQTKANYTLAAYTTDGVACLAEEFGGTPQVCNPSMTVAPTADYWAYNVFPNFVPHIIIKLSSVTYKKGTDPAVTLTDRYITVKNFKYTSALAGHHAAGDVIAALEPTNVYTLSTISFDYTHLSEIPEDSIIDAMVKVEMMPWVDNQISWDN